MKKIGGQLRTFRDGLLCRLGFALTACFFEVLADAAGVWRPTLTTFAVLVSLFS
jgi:hypothetical protein